MRCQSCLQIRIADIRDTEVLQQPSFLALKSSAESGCDLCNISYVAMISNYSDATMRFQDKEMRIIDILCHGYNPTRVDDRDTRVFLEGEIEDFYKCDQYKEKVEKIVVRVGEFLVGRSSIQAFLQLGVDSESVLTKYIAGRMPSQRSDIPTALSRVKDWIATCDQKHESCAFLSEDGPQPKRILDISKERPIVVHTESAVGRYVALSYCWGTSGKNVLLTSSTFDKFTSVGINIDTLPKTIQNAITVCKSLGVYSIWIDALCIIQKEPNLKDFIAEAPRMADYYRNAYLTLIAGCAQDCADGFLRERSSPEAAPCEITYDRLIFASDRDMTGSVKIFLPRTREYGPIQDRAWTFQESKLSQRALVYGLGQMHFICPMYSTFEDGESNRIRSPAERLPSSPSGYPNIHHLVRHSGKKEIVGRAYDLWFGLLHSYTSRKLSDPNDKLAAIAGYASLLSQIVQCRYMYGLWEDSLPEALLWQPRRPWRSTEQTGSVTRISDRAPSWSWASIDGPILHPVSLTRRRQSKDPKAYEIKIVSYDKVPRSFDPIRKVVNASDAFEIEVCGLVGTVWHAPSMSSRHSDLVLSILQVACDSKCAVGAKEKQFQNDSAQENVATGTWDTYDDFESKTYWGQQMYALLVIPESGLLLKYVDGKRYRRIGRFWKAKDELLKNMSPEDMNLI